MKRTPLPLAVIRAVLGLFLSAAVSLLAHDTWLSPTPSTAKLGETVTVQLASGHSFPAAGEPVKGVELKMTVFDPHGQSILLVPADKGRGPEAAFEVLAEGFYRVACEYDRGVISRTPAGWKPGGRSVHTNATSVLKAYNSFLCAIRTSGAPLDSPGPLGLLFEVSWMREGRRLIVLATSGGNPVGGAEISAVIGSGDARSAGKTDAAGRLAIEIPEAFKGPIFLAGSVSRPMPAGSEYDAERTSSSYYLTWE